jgi:regulator of cell morphogenesis and NO signaling
MAQETLQEQSADKTIGDFVAEDYRTAEVFEKHGIDFCCGGKMPLSEACRRNGIEVDQILREIEASRTTPIPRSENYAAWDLSFLADYIYNTHHVYLRENLGRIAAYARKVAEVHGTNHPEVVEIASIFEKVAADMDVHLKEEEEVLFPAVKRIEAASKAGLEPDPKDVETIAGSLDQLTAEHDDVGEAVHTIRRLSRDYEIPPDACNTFSMAYRMLLEFEEDLHKHVHLENNILFPKADYFGQKAKGKGQKV